MCVTPVRVLNVCVVTCYKVLINYKQMTVSLIVCANREVCGLSTGKGSHLTKHTSCNFRLNVFDSTAFICIQTLNILIQSLNKFISNLDERPHQQCSCNVPTQL